MNMSLIFVYELSNVLLEKNYNHMSYLTLASENIDICKFT